MNSVGLAKTLMKRFETFPVSPQVRVGKLEEVFNHPIFLNGSETKRKEIMLKSSEASYQSEIEYPWDRYFGVDLSPLLKGKVALDLGCFSGGRSVAWLERYQLDHLVGIDVDQTYIDAAKQFAEAKKITAEFRLAQGESLSFQDETFDAVLTFEVFEHVQNVQRTLEECHRVLKMGGKLLVVFPGYFHPIAHHLSLVTTAPFLNNLFSGETLVRAYYEILEERGADAYWYKRRSPHLEAWEKSNTINGTTAAQFRNYIKNHHWKIVLHSRKPIGSIGRSISNRRLFRLLSLSFHPLTYVPFLQEIFLHRITYILEKS